MKTENTEYNKIRQVAKDYEKNGYNVIIEPRGNDIPTFIQNYEPDIIATNEKETVIIEIKSRDDLKTIEMFKDIADIVNKKEKWRFELIVTAPKKKIETEKSGLNNDYEISEIRTNLLQVKGLLNQGIIQASFILGWANLESLSRQLLLKDKKNLTKKDTLVLIKTLFSFGYLTRADYASLEKLFQVRNRIVHGYKSYSLNDTSVNQLLDIIEKLLAEKNDITND